MNHSKTPEGVLRPCIALLAAMAMPALCQGVMERDPAGPEPGRKAFELTFEKGQQSVMPLKFTNSNKMLETVVTNVDGESVFRISTKPMDKEKVDTWFWWRLNGKAPVKGGKEIAVVVEARGDVSMKYCGGKRGPQTAVFWHGADGKNITAQDEKGRDVPIFENFGYESLGKGWVRSIARFTVPEEASFVSLQIGCDWPDIPPGKHIEFRRIAVREREDGGSWYFGDIGDEQPPTYKRISPSPVPDPMAEVVFRVDDKSALDMKRFSCKMDDVDVTARLARSGNVFTYRPEKPWEKDSLHLFKVTAADIHGNVSSETLAFFCGEPFRKGICTLRDDGMALVDGKPFFPIAPFSYQKCPMNDNGDFVKGFRDMQAQGFNAIQTYRCYHYEDQRKGKYNKDYHEQFLKMVEASDITGMKIICEVAGRDYANPLRPQRLREIVLFSRNHPNLFVWVLGDDTASFRQPQDVQNDQNIIKAMDNANFTGSADTSTYVGRYRWFVHCTDVMMDEIYPFRAEVPEPYGLAMVKQDMKNAYVDKAAVGDPPKGIWALVQTFSEVPLWKRFPTRAEIRGQAYIAIIHGSKGMTFFNYYSYSRNTNAAGCKPNQLEDLYSVSRELGSIQDDLASRDAKAQPKVTMLAGAKKDPCRFDTVTCLLKEGAPGKTPLLLAASSRTDQTTPVEISLPGPFTKAEVLFEGRTVAVANGVLADSFGPGEVHVYRLAK